MGNDNYDKDTRVVFSRRIKAGTKRTYFFDVKESHNNNCFLVITESRRRLNDGGFDRDSIYIYREDINKFVEGLIDVVDVIKTEIMPNYDFTAFDHHDEQPKANKNNSEKPAEEAPEEENFNVLNPSKHPNTEFDSMKKRNFNIDENDRW